MKEKRKEDTLKDFIEMVYNSWTYAKMTDNEKEQLTNLLQNDGVIREGLKGSYQQRLKILQIFYIGYLGGLGYNNGNWREEKEVK